MYLCCKVRIDVVDDLLANVYKELCEREVRCTMRVLFVSLAMFYFSPLSTCQVRCSWIEVVFKGFD